MTAAQGPHPAPRPGAPAPRVPHLPPRLLGRLQRFFALLQAISPALAARVAFHLFLRTFRRPLPPEDRAALARARAHHLMAGADPMTVHEWDPAIEDGAPVTPDGAHAPAADHANAPGPRTVIVLHGWGSGAARFTRLAEALQARGWRVLVPDAPGHGASPGRSSSLPQFIAGLDAIAARFGAPQALVGHSLGALGICCRFASQPPDWAGQLQSVVLIATPSGAPFLVQVFVDALRIREATRQHLARLFERRFAVSPAAFTALPGARGIPARLLVVHDEGDDIVPHAHSTALLQDIAGAILHTTRELGHSLLTRDHATIRHIVEFVDGGDAPPL